MNFEMFVYAMLFMLGGVLYLATASIGIQAYNDNPDYKLAKGGTYGNNFIFLGFNIVFSVIMIIISFYAISRAFSDK